MTDRDERAAALQRLTRELDGLDAAAIGQLVALARRLHQTPSRAETIGGAAVTWGEG